MAVRHRHHGGDSAQSEKAEYSDHNHHETDDIDNIVHKDPPDLGGMPIRHGEELLNRADRCFNNQCHAGGNVISLKRGSSHHNHSDLFHSGW